MRLIPHYSIQQTEGALISRKMASSYGIGVRHMMSGLLFLGMMVNYMMRINLSIGIVLMTDNNTQTSAQVFDWSVAEQSFALSSFFITYFFMNFASAVLVTKLNIKYLLLLCGGVSSVISLATPLLVNAAGYYALVAVRLALGLVQGFLMSSIWGVSSKWIPPGERSRNSALILGGVHMGSLVSLMVSGWIGANYGGWPSVFYFSGGVGGLWTVLWLFLGAESPEESGLVSDDERTYISKSLEDSHQLPKNVRIPWREMACSKACWGIIIGTLAHGWGYWTLVTEIPSYFNAVLRFSPTLNGLVSALPYGCMWVLCLISSQICDKLQEKEIITATFSRKLNNSIGQYGAGICLVVLGYTTDEGTAILMYILGVSLLGCSYIGHPVCNIDILPNFAGFLMGITNGTGILASFAGPVFAGQVIHDASNVDEWRIVFLVSGGVFAVGNTLFLLMATSEVQPFNNIPTGQEKTVEKKNNDEII